MYASLVSKYIDLIYKQVIELENNHKNYFDSKTLIAFRGESEDYKLTKLMPSLFRNNEWVKKEGHIFELLSDYNMIKCDATNIEKAIEAQHYLEISRMLDISFNVLVALYFACQDNKSSDSKMTNKHDGVIYVFAFPEHYSPHSNYIEQFYENMLNKHQEPYYRNFKVFSHSYNNERIRVQKGGFIFFPGDKFHPINDIYYRMINIKKEEKSQILGELQILFQIDKAYIFPEKTNISEIVKNKFKTSNYDSKYVNFNDEIKTYLNRIDYELTMIKDREGNIKEVTEINKKLMLRNLRKEEYDITNYINGYNGINYAVEDRENILKEIKKRFLLYKIMFKEV